MVLTPKKHSSSARAIHLTSEDAPVAEDSLALSTTGAFLRMFEAWWLEFKLKDGRAGTLQNKLRTLFKGSGVSVSLKPYEAGDGFLAFDPPDAPPASYAWLPPPPKKVELVENDLLFFERQSRISIRALNFAEVILQTWKNGDLQDDALLQMQHSLSRAVKCITQAQMASLCGLIQLRRDHYLAAAKGLSVDDLQALRHAPLLGMPSLFPDATLRELNEKHHKALQTKALMQSTAKKESSSQRKSDSRPKPPYDDFAPHWSVEPVLDTVVGASPPGPPTASGCLGDSPKSVHKTLPPLLSKLRCTRRSSFPLSHRFPRNLWTLGHRRTRLRGNARL